ncbi:MAG: MBL fold metallo-hydrolase [Chloroflexi bacterium]|nr:MBL fold metallo-hydrolase [Chloroflexota bacterium]
MPIEVLSMTLGAFATNAYLVADSETKNAVLIDPVDSAPVILNAAAERGWRIQMMVATHAHLDHVMASKAIKDDLGIPFCIHEECLPWLADLPAQAKLFGLGDIPAAAQPDRLLTSAGEVIELDAIRLKTLFTPGHAPGHLSLLLEGQKILFSGDTLFAGSIGRTDLPGGDYPLLMRSILDKLMTLDDAYRVLPGHMGATTIGRERNTNPFLLSFDQDAQ